jgi:CO dehydrogenase/acetyl-CoA synthase beta subunit
MSEKWFELSATIQCKNDDQYKFIDDLSDWLEANGHDWIAMRISPIEESEEDGEEQCQEETRTDNQTREVGSYGKPWKLVRREPSNED